MNIEEYRLYCLSKPHTTEGTPFHNSDNYLVFKVAGKMFTATDMNTFETISVKCDPEEIEKLREEYDGVNTQPYMSKKHWNSVRMNADIPDRIVFQWIDNSYRLAIKNLTKKMRVELFGE